MPKGIYIRTEKHKKGLSAARRKTWADPNSAYHTEEFLKSRINSGSKNGRYGKKFTDEEKLAHGKKIKKLRDDPNSIYNSKEWREKMSLMHSDPNSVYQSQEYRDKISKANTGKKHSPEACKRHSRAVSGKKHPMWGKHHTEESKKKLSIASKNMWKDTTSKVNTDKYRKKLSESLTGEKNPNYGIPCSKSKKLKQSIAMKKIMLDLNSVFNTTEYKEKRNNHLASLHKHPKKGPSKIEIIVKKLLDDLKIEYKFQEHISPYTVDFLIPKNKLIIEVDGKYDHGDPRIYNATDKIRGNKTAKEKWDYDLKRDNILRKKDLQLYVFGKKKLKLK